MVAGQNPSQCWPANDQGGVFHSLTEAKLETKLSSPSPRQGIASPASALAVLGRRKTFSQHLLISAPHFL